MRAWLQIAVLAVIGGGLYLWQSQAAQWGIPTPLALIGLERPAAESVAARAPATNQVAVVAAPVRQAEVVERMESVGTVRAREAVTITTKVAGMVTAVRFEEGQRVAAGDVLMELDSEALRAELYQARAQLDNAQSQLSRARALPAGQAVARARVDELETLARGADGRLRQIQARIDELRLTAPFDGTVGLRQVSVGALIQPGTPVTSLDDLRTVRVEFAVPEVHVARVAPGSPVRARSAAHGSRVFEGRVTVMDTRIDTATRTMRVISEFDNSDGALRPGLFLTVQLTLEIRPTALLVPEEALDALGERNYVYAIRDGRARRIPVQLGLRLPGEVEIREGVVPGDQVVVRGLQRLRPDMPVRVTETMTRPTS